VAQGQHPALRGRSSGRVLLLRAQWAIV
jgi:hypothetical protein